MNFELPKTENQPAENPEALDDKWYERFKEVGSFQAYEYLIGNKEKRDAQKRDFLDREIENPALDYPELEKIDFPKTEEKFLLLKSELLENEKNETVKQLYRWRINEKLAELRMLKAAGSGNDRRFVRYLSFIYGKPEKEIYEYTISQIKKIVDEKMFNQDPETSSAAKRLNKELFEALMNNENEINPENYNMKPIKSTREEKEFSAEEIRQAFEDYLKDQAIGGWEVIIDKDGKFTGINVSQEKRSVNIPQSRKLKRTYLEALIQHELGTHVRRREMGEKTKLKLLGLGLDRFLKGEEGIATYEMQKIEGAKDFSGFEGHFAISLALGVDGKKRDFRKVFDILKDYFFITSKKSKTEALKSSQESAWDRCSV